VTDDSKGSSAGVACLFPEAILDATQNKTVEAVVLNLEKPFERIDQESHDKARRNGFLNWAPWS